MLWPVLRPVEYPRDFNRVFLDLIHRNIGKGRECKLAASAYPVAEAAHVRKVL